MFAGLVYPQSYMTIIEIGYKEGAIKLIFLCIYIN